MSNYDNTNRGAMWNNERKQSENHPDFSGSINIEGKEYWISGWRKKEGAPQSAPVVSMSVRPKDEQGFQHTSSPAPANKTDNFTDIPF